MTTTGTVGLALLVAALLGVAVQGVLVLRLLRRRGGARPSFVAGMVVMLCLAGHALTIGAWWLLPLHVATLAFQAWAFRTTLSRASRTGGTPP